MKHLVLVLSLFVTAVAYAQTPPWTPSIANDWYVHQPWIAGADYIQSNTINQIEMWQPETFDVDRIDLELGWAENLGINTLRISLPFLEWEQNSGGVQRRINKLLDLLQKHKMRVIFVLFDSVGDPYPEAGHQHQPKPGVRNSQWVQSPGAKGLVDAKELQKALLFAESVVADFSIDKRILAWEVWNDPDNTNIGRFNKSEPPNKLDLVRTILPEAFRYVRAGLPTQPVTSSLWQGDWSSKDKLSPVQKLQIELSDIISFQNYDGPAEFEKRVKWLQAFGRPVICTGFLDRNHGSTLEAILPIALKYNVGVLVGDLVEGKPQTWLPWDSWQEPYVGDRKPALWTEDLFTRTGPPYSQKEADFLKEIIASAPKPAVGKPPKKGK
jgi:hypothetical protein